MYAVPRTVHGTPKWWTCLPHHFQELKSAEPALSFSALVLYRIAVLHSFPILEILVAAN